MISAPETLVRIDVTPCQVTHGLPNGLIDEYREGKGFEDRLMVIPTENHEFITFQISYDGESEMIAKVYTNLYKYSEEKCEEILRKIFGE